mgnify:FL=1
MKKRHLVSLVTLLKDSLFAHRMANWNDDTVIELVAEITTKKFANYMKDQEGLESLNMSEEDCMIPPNGLGQDK